MAATMHPYLNFNGNCEEAFQMYKEVLGGEIEFLGRYSEMPAEVLESAGDVDKDLVMHATLRTGAGDVLMGSDVGGDWANNFTAGTNFSLSLNADSREHAESIFGALSEGGTVGMPMNDTFWGDYFGMLTDKFGINWMVSFAIE